MEFLYILIGLIIGIFSFLYWKYISNKRIEQYKKNQYEKEKQKILSKINQDIQSSHEELNLLNNEIEQKKTFNTTILKIREDELNNIIEAKKVAQESQLQLEIDNWAKSAQEAASFNASLIIKDLNKSIDDMNETYSALKTEIEDWRAKRDAINQEILRSRAIEEQQDFYRIQLDESAKRDMSLINSIRSQFSKIDLLDKLIYDIYVKKAVDEMIKRVLKGQSPSGIYKITRLKTGEIYIGKSTDVKSRWQQHAKSTFHCGTISHSLLHTTMEKDGIDNFIWELIEEVPKDKLSEREKYWIDVYDSKKYGLNEKLGG